jgi:hypothetical protein
LIMRNPYPQKLSQIEWKTKNVVRNQNVNYQQSMIC